MLSLTQKVYQTLEIHGKRFIWNSPRSPVRDPQSCLARQTTPGNHDPDIRQSESVPPIHRIPIEVLGEIFSWYLDEPADSFSRYAKQSSVTAALWSKFDPLLLGHICTYWRMVSLSMPTLWSSIAISKPTLSQIPFIQVWLGRAQGCSLSLGILQSEEPDDMEQKTTNDILKLFLTRAHLWRHVDFRLHQNVPNLQLRNLPATPVLESVHLRMQGWDRTFVDEVWCGIHSLRSLRKVGWLDVYMENEMPAHAPWAQLTHIDMRPGMRKELCFEKFLTALRQCQELVSFKCYVIMPSDPSYQTLPITLPKLRILKFSICTGGVPDPLFQHLILPSLISLELTQDFRRAPIHRLHWLKDFLNRSGCRLEKLLLWDAYFKEDELVDLLISPGMQYLVHLELRALRRVADRTLKLLTHPVEETTRLLPRLEALIFTDCHTSEGVLYGMIASRLPVLKMVQIRFPHDIPTQDLLSLKSLLSTGCDLTIKPDVNTMILRNTGIVIARE